MTRVVAGAARGRRLAVPTGTGTRPTSDRAREGLFSALAALLGGVGDQALAGLRVLDLYAGSGAVGLEALSRGAAHVLLVEKDQRAATVVRANVAATGLPGACVVLARAERLVAAPPEAPATAPYDVVFLDPPYDVPDAVVEQVLRDLLHHRWLRPEALLVVERATRGGGPAWPVGTEGLRSRRYGEGTLWYGRAAGVVPPPA